MGWFSRLFSSGKARRQAFWDDNAGDDRIVMPARSKSKTRRASSLPRFSGTASDQMHRPRAASPLDKVRFRLRNAFTPSQPVSQIEMFAGRDQTLRTLIRSIEDQQLHVVLYGDRGIGKTSMLHVLSQLARDARYQVRYASCGEEAGFDDMFRAIARDIPLLYYRDLDPTSEQIEQGGTLAELLPATPLTVPVVSDLFEKISGTRVLIILDEFDRAQSSAFRRSIAELIKNLSDRSVRVQIVIAGVAANLTELIEHIPSIRRNILGLQVPVMTSEEITALIQNGESASGLTYLPDAVSAIDAVANGSPYLASLLAQHAGLNAIGDDREDVNRDDVVEAVNLSLEEIRHRVSAASLHFIGRAQSDGQGAMLGMLGRIALRNGGRVLASDVDVLVQTPQGGITYLDSMMARYHLVEPIKGDPAGGYGFSEEGVPVFLWMEYAQQRLAMEKDGKERLEDHLARYRKAGNKAA